ncbi:MAG: hypothetical protein FJ087_07580 [Deltaproteobacteria bacterium]|nr:hypothetical protein [Deltaproteobacteria bacterium]
MSHGAAPIRVLVVEDGATVRGRLVEVLSADPGIQVVGEAEDGRTAIELALAPRPSAIALDMMLPVMTIRVSADEDGQPVPPRGAPGRYRGRGGRRAVAFGLYKRGVSSYKQCPLREPYPGRALFDKAEWPSGLRQRS